MAEEERYPDGPGRRGKSLPLNRVLMPGEAIDMMRSVEAEKDPVYLENIRKGKYIVRE